MNSPKIDVALIGAQKAGTTSYYDWLAQHPQIFAPSFYKDNHFFLRPDELAKELSNFFETKKDEISTLHGAVNYMYFDKSVEALKQHNPDIKIIVLLRNPAKRAFSSYLYHRKKQKENLSFRERIDLDLNDSITDYYDQSNLTYASHGFYFKQLKPFFDAFAPEQIKVFLFEELLQNKNEMLRESFDFMNVDPDFEVNFSHKNNTGKTRYDGVSKLVYGKNPIKNLVREAIRPFLGKEQRSKLKEYIVQANTSKNREESITPEDYNYLMNLYEEDINQLAKLIHKDVFKVWPKNM